MTLESKLRALVAEWRGATKAISADGASRPLEWEGKDILRLCADRIEALLAERPRCIGYPDCDGDLEGEPHSEKCPLADALAERQEPPPVSADFFLMHETSYLQKPSGRYEWRCTCGDLAEDFATWTDCHRYSRQHWANGINALLAAAAPSSGTGAKGQ